MKWWIRRNSICILLVVGMLVFTSFAVAVKPDLSEKFENKKEKWEDNWKDKEEDGKDWDDKWELKRQKKIDQLDEKVEKFSDGNGDGNNNNGDDGGGNVGSEIYFIKFTNDSIMGNFTDEVNETDGLSIDWDTGYVYISPPSRNRNKSFLTLAIVLIVFALMIGMVMGFAIGYVVGKSHCKTRLDSPKVKSLVKEK